MMRGDKLSQAPKDKVPKVGDQFSKGPLRGVKVSEVCVSPTTSQLQLAYIIIM